jgi:crotonobetainyl-CoA:carnitine CoA-transferase CaiB-like acyl-CoA transferase
MGGLMNQTGDSKPVLAGTWAADYGAGLYAAFGTVLALLYREHTGVGQHVDVSLLETIFSWLRTSVADFLLFGKKYDRTADRNPYRCPVGTFETSDGYIYITATTHEQFAGVCKCAGHVEWADDPRFSSELVRLDHAEEFCNLVTKWTKTVTSEICLEMLIKADVPCAPINDVEQVLANPQIQARKGVVWKKCHTGQEIPLINVTVKMSEAPGSIRLPPPRIGEYNEDYYCGKLGLSAEEIAKLKADGVI